MTNKYSAINAIRFSAAVGIIAMHVLLLGQYQIPTFAHNIISRLSAFVELFFILSGFSMSCGYYDRVKNNTINVDDFYKRRIIKLAPLFVLVVLSEGIYSWEWPVSFIEIFANITMMFGLMSNHSLEIASIGWTLGVVFVFYMIFPFFVFLIGNKRRGVITLFMTLGVHFVCKYYFLDSGQHQNISLWLYEFVIGGLLFLFQNEIKKINKNSIIIITLFLSIGVVIIEGLGYRIEELKALLFSLWIICGMLASGKCWTFRRPGRSR